MVQKYQFCPDFGLQEKNKSDLPTGLSMKRISHKLQISSEILSSFKCSIYCCLCSSSLVLPKQNEQPTIDEQIAIIYIVIKLLVLDSKITYLSYHLDPLGRLSVLLCNACLNLIFCGRN